MMLSGSSSLGPLTGRNFTGERRCTEQPAALPNGPVNDPGPLVLPSKFWNTSLSTSSFECSWQTNQWTVCLELSVAALLVPSGHGTLSHPASFPPYFFRVDQQFCFAARYATDIHLKTIDDGPYSTVG